MKAAFVPPSLLSGAGSDRRISRLHLRGAAVGFCAAPPSARRRIIVPGHRLWLQHLFINSRRVRCISASFGMTCARLRAPASTPGAGLVCAHNSVLRPFPNTQTCPPSPTPTSSQQAGERNDMDHAGVKVPKTLREFKSLKNGVCENWRRERDSRHFAQKSRKCWCFEPRKTRAVYHLRVHVATDAASTSPRRRGRLNPSYWQAGQRDLRPLRLHFDIPSLPFCGGSWCGRVHEGPLGSVSLTCRISAGRFQDRSVASLKANQLRHPPIPASIQRRPRSYASRNGAEDNRTA